MTGRHRWEKAHVAGAIRETTANAPEPAAA